MTKYLASYLKQPSLPFLRDPYSFMTRPPPRPAPPRPAPGKLVYENRKGREEDALAATLKSVKGPRVFQLNLLLNLHSKLNLTFKRLTKLQFSKTSQDRS